MVGIFGVFQHLLSHLELSDPGAVPVGLRNQLYKEFPLSPALHGWWGGGVWRGIGSRGNRDGIRGITPSPVEDLLDTSFDRRALKEDAYRFFIVLSCILESPS